jgi:hypothetical protein
MMSVVFWRSLSELEGTHGEEARERRPVRCTEADLMMADEAVASRRGPWICLREGRYPNQCVGPHGWSQQ